MQAQVAFPSAPSWALYSGDNVNCMSDVPVLIPATTFCSTFLGEAHVVHNYSTWSLAMLLEKSGLQLHTYPHVAFRVVHFSVSSATNCNHELIPKVSLAFRVSMPTSKSQAPPSWAALQASICAMR